MTKMELRKMALGIERRLNNAAGVDAKSGKGSYVGIRHDSNDSTWYLFGKIAGHHKMMELSPRFRSKNELGVFLQGALWQTANEGHLRVWHGEDK